MPREKRSYEVEHVHGLWHFDFHEGSRAVLLRSGDWLKPLLLGVLDDRSRLCAVDAISCLGAVPLEMDAWGIDVVVSGSQKALMTPPGLAFAAPSEAAMQAEIEKTAR